MVFSRNFVLDYIFQNMKSLNPEFDLYCSRNKCGLTKIVLNPISEVSARTVSLLNTHNHTQYTFLFVYVHHMLYVKFINLWRLWGGRALPKRLPIEPKQGKTMAQSGGKAESEASGPQSGRSSSRGRARRRSGRRRSRRRRGWKRVGRRPER